MSLGNILTSNTVATAYARGTHDCGSMALYLDENVVSFSKLSSAMHEVGNG